MSRATYLCAQEECVRSGDTDLSSTSVRRHVDVASILVWGKWLSHWFWCQTRTVEREVGLGRNRCTFRQSQVYISFTQPAAQF